METEEQEATGSESTGPRGLRRRRGRWQSGFCVVEWHDRCPGITRVPVKTDPRGFVYCGCKPCDHEYKEAPSGG